MSIMIGKADDLVTAGFKPGGSCLFVFCLIRFSMRVTINFYDKLCLCTIEIGNELPDWMLSTDFESQPTISYAGPYFGFSRRERVAMVTSQFQNGRDDLESCLFVHCHVFYL